MLATSVSTEPKPFLETQSQLSTFFQNFILTDVGEGAASDDTVKTYRIHLTQYLRWCEQNSCHPLMANRDNLKQYRHWLIVVQNYRSSTISLKLTVVRRFYDGLLEKGYVSHNPAFKLKPPLETIDPAARINYLESDEMSSLLASLPQEKTVKALRDRLLVAVMVLEGCRTVELHRLNVEDLVRRGNHLGLQVQGKRRTRIVPLTPELAKLLKRYLLARSQTGESISAESPLFLALDHINGGKRLSRRSIGRIVDKYLRAIGLKEKPQKKTYPSLQKPKKKSRPKRTLSAHSLRHTAGTLALRAGASLIQVQDLLGHADPRTTVIYAHIADRWEHNPALLLERPLL